MTDFLNQDIILLICNILSDREKVFFLSILSSLHALKLKLKYHDPVRIDKITNLLYFEQFTNVIIGKCQKIYYDSELIVPIIPKEKIHFCDNLTITRDPDSYVVHIGRHHRIKIIKLPKNIIHVTIIGKTKDILNMIEYSDEYNGVIFKYDFTCGNTFTIYDCRMKHGKPFKKFIPKINLFNPKYVMLDK